VGVTLGRFALFAVLLAGAFLVFGRVRSEYRARGALSRPTAGLQVAFLCAYALSSYAFLDARLSQVNAASVLFVVAITLMILGLLMIVLSMPFLGKRSFGEETGGLCTTGIYRYSRNPQLLGGFLFILGYALLWPSWMGLLWVALWPVIMHLMVRGEEEHLEAVFGDAYRRYCELTPRYLGLPGR
jgi:protein-S-isoprenylcysteine O-methyltransferase Ste14